MQRLSVEEATADLRVLLDDRRSRVVIGLTGPPGAGKSTLAQQLARAMPGATLVPMDGYHLAHAALQRLGTAGRKGAPDTFDAEGYVALLRRLREPASGPIWAPEFRREIEDAIAGAIEVAPQCRLVITEGNYLLLDTEPWRQVRGLLDAVWYVDVPDDVRQQRLTARHMAYGRDGQEALGRTLGSDQANADLVATTRDRADALVTLG